MEKNTEFIENFQNAILFALLEKGQLSKRQFDFCVSKAGKQQENAGKPEGRADLCVYEKQDDREGGQKSP